jgi:hypothetical protein
LLPLRCLAGLGQGIEIVVERRSALLTVCSYFENELDKLCRLYQFAQRIIFRKSLALTYMGDRKNG